MLNFSNLSNISIYRINKIGFSLMILGKTLFTTGLSLPVSINDDSPTKVVSKYFQIKKLIQDILLRTNGFNLSIIADLLRHTLNELPTQTNLKYFFY